MLLKIFTKRKPHGEMLKTELAWKDSYIEASKIRMTPLLDKDRIDFYAVNNDEHVEHGSIDLKTHGYELYNSSGVMFEKYVSVIKE